MSNDLAPAPASGVAAPSYAHGASRTPLLGQTIGVYFDAAADRFGGRDALIVRHQRVRWRQLKERVDAFAAGLVALGSNPASGSASGRRTTPNGPWPNSRPPRPG